LGGVDFGCGGGNWVVVLICQNVCPRFWPDIGNWVVVVVVINWVVIKSGKDGASDIEHITIFL